ncbi:TPR repeat-containing thioredoxin ttl1 [Turnera subulata]|uniref:TPR repeat-containing thioredoxin ttl1 n=1 Tax=Turnera subulata TaxID=218843 RepID=A0A9Q0GBA1_9ROSI|nr:TPR repeat-containing thioredoxin ttl1 [Turnera subulata]
MSHHHHHHPVTGLESLRLSSPEVDGEESNKPDFRELDLGSPVSPLRTRGATNPSSSSSSSSGSRNPHQPPKSNPNGSSSYNNNCYSNSNNHNSNNSNSSSSSHSGELSNSCESSLTTGRNSSRPRSDPSTANSPLNPNLNLLPTGNICPSGKIFKTMPNRPPSKSDVLGSGTANYGHGSIIMRKSAPPPTNNWGIYEGSSPNVDAAEEVKRAGNDMYKKGLFAEALALYDRAIALAPRNAAYHSNRAAALMALGRLPDALRECQDALKLDPHYLRAHQRLASLLIRLGFLDNARKHLCFPGQHTDQAELQRLKLVEKHLTKCSDARKVNDWKCALREADAAIAAGADYSPQLFMCRAEAFLKLHQLEDAESCLSSIPKLEPYPDSFWQTRFFGMLSEAYPFLVRAQIDMALGRFDSAVTAAEKASQIDPQHVEVAVMVNNVRLVARARARGNDLFKSERFTEACSAYGEGLKLDPSNSVLFCNRAACWFKLGLWERSIDDCNQALSIQPNYTKALLRRAASNSKLERWADAVRDYEVLRRELPDDNEVAECHFHAQVALKKSRGEEVHNMKFGGEVEEIFGFEQFKAAISLPGISVVHFKSSSNFHCKQISPFVNTLCGRYPSINFLKVDIEENAAIATSENVRIVPTFKIYKNGSRLKEIVCPSRELLEYSVRHYSL